MKNLLFLALMACFTLVSCEEVALTGDVTVYVVDDTKSVGIFDPIVLSENYSGRFYPKNAIKVAENITSNKTIEGLLSGTYICAELYSSGTYYETFQIIGGETVNVTLGN